MDIRIVLLFDIMYIIMILVTGSAGFLGHYLCDELEKNSLSFYGIDIREGNHVNKLVDLRNSNQLEDLLDQLNPTCIVHCAKIAESADFCENHPKEAYIYNYQTTFNLLKLILHKKIKFVNISSDYVYDGKKGNFTEEDIPYPVNFYGITKVLGEEISKFAYNYVNLRPTVIFGYDEHGMNFFMQLLRNQKAHTSMQVPIDQISNPTYIYTLTKAIRLSIEKDITGTFNATGPESVSRYDFSLMLAEKFSWNKDLIESVETKSLNQKAKRPLNCSTDPSKLQAELEFCFPSLQDNLSHLYQEYKTITNNSTGSS